MTEEQKTQSDQLAEEMGIPEWFPTLQLRWVRRFGMAINSAPDKVLQQLWRSRGGQAEWRTVPIWEE